MSQRVIHFEIHADNPDRAVIFYEQLFGWKFHKWDGPIPYWLISTGDGPGIDGGLMPRRGSPPLDGAALNSFASVINVANLDDLIVRIPAAGGEIVVPKSPVPGVGYLAYAKDTERNIFGMMQSDQSAR